MERCLEREVPISPGAVTATKIMAALELSLTTVKFFPTGASGGVAMIAALAAPFTGVRFGPTEGISRANTRDYMSLSSVAAIGGSWIVPSDRIAEDDCTTIRRLTAEKVVPVTSTT